MGTRSALDYILLCAAVSSIAVAVAVALPTSRRGGGAEPLRRSPIRGAPVSTQGAHPLGTTGAPRDLIVFTDFACPSCRALHATLHELRARHAGAVNVVYRHYFGGANVVGYRAAIAAECAAAQGRFVPYADALFARQDSLGSTDWDALAVAVDTLDTASFRACRTQPETRRHVMADLEEGGRLELRGTPAVVFDGEVMIGAAPLNTLERWLELPASTAADARPR